MSPDLFSLYGQRVMEELREEEGISIGGRNVTNTRYADDTVLEADSEEKLQRLVDALYGGCVRFEPTINTGRGKTETVGTLQVRVTLNGREIQQVNGYNYLGSRL